MNRPLLVALPAALAGFGLWVWITGPGTDVPNALIAFVVAVASGRIAWWLVARRDAEDTGSGVGPGVPPGGGR